MEPLQQDIARSELENPSLGKPWVLRWARPTDHVKLVKLAKSSPYTSHFSNRLMFSSDAAYHKGWIRFLYDSADPDNPMAFTCVRHKSRGNRATMLYFLTVRPDLRSKGLGAVMVNDLKEQAPAKIVELSVAKRNDRALEFYKLHGFEVVGESLFDKEGMAHGWHMKWKA